MMYIDPFVAGILATLLVEAVIFIGLVLIFGRKKK